MDYECRWGSVVDDIAVVMIQSIIIGINKRTTILLRTCNAERPITGCSIEYAWYRLHFYQRHLIVVALSQNQSSSKPVRTKYVVYWVLSRLKGTKLSFNTSAFVRHPLFPNDRSRHRKKNCDSTSRAIIIGKSVLLYKGATVISHVLYVLVYHRTVCTVELVISLKFFSSTVSPAR